MVQLSHDQETALTRINQWLRGPEKFFILEGCAGTGKTELARRIGDPSSTIYCALTGKAANVLRNRGLEATTLHRALYKPKEKGRATLQAHIDRLEAVEMRMKRAYGAEALSLRKECDQLRAQIRAERKRVASPSWEVPQDAAIKSAKLVVIDEYSMLDQRICADLQQHAKKVLLLGDPYQLPPVYGPCPLSGKPDYTLTQVHRQAADNPLLWALTHIREKGYPPTQFRANELGSWEYLSKDEATWEAHYSKADQTIVGRNKTRNGFNRRHRARLGYTGLVCQNDRIIFMRNQHEEEIFNGTTAIVQEAVEADDIMSMDVVLDDGRFTTVDVWAGTFRGEPPDRVSRGTQLADHAFAITCHKSQGSEYDHVLVWEESWGSAEERSRWMYTAASRARKRCTFVHP